MSTLVWKDPPPAGKAGPLDTTKVLTMQVIAALSTHPGAWALVDEAASPGQTQKWQRACRPWSELELTSRWNHQAGGFDVYLRWLET